MVTFVILVLVRRQKVHAALAKGVVDLKNHGRQPPVRAVQVPERDRVEVVAEEARSCNQVGVRVA
jgi:hypothetical protein